MTFENIQSIHSRVLSTKEMNAKIFYPPLNQQLLALVFLNSNPGLFLQELFRESKGISLEKTWAPLGASLVVHETLCFLHSSEGGNFQLMRFNDVSLNVFPLALLKRFLRSPQWFT